MISKNFYLRVMVALSLMLFSACTPGTSAPTEGLNSSLVIESESLVSSAPLLTPVQGISHAHGLAVDVQDGGKIYIATHHGLLMLENETELYRIGEIQDDFMGFSDHPTQSNVFFTSGHSQQGGHLGVQRSDDGGVSWKKISDGVSGPVDFHSMTLSRINPNLLYGWYRGLQRSTDGGKTWEQVPSSLQNVITLAADPQDEKILYAATTNGIKVSRDQGKTWDEVSKQLSKGPIMTLAIDPKNNQTMLSYSQILGMSKSVDGGKQWKKIPSELGAVLHIAFNPNDSNIIYALNGNSQLYKSLDGAENWKLVQ